MDCSNIPFATLGFWRFFMLMLYTLVLGQGITSHNVLSSFGCGGLNYRRTAPQDGNIQPSIPQDLSWWWKRMHLVLWIQAMSCELAICYPLLLMFCCILMASLHHRVPMTQATGSATILTGAGYTQLGVHVTDPLQSALLIMTWLWGIIGALALGTSTLMFSGLEFQGHTQTITLKTQVMLRVLVCDLLMRGVLLLTELKLSSR